ncbi:MAG: serine/threonine protein kinase, partial [Planctomycetes bacterium]|nr:serine/threonine protein kinase [Planctomycetota bacterium]
MQPPPQIGPFRVLSAVARGGGGEVYRVAHPEGGPDLALKLLVNAPTPRSLRRFETEVAALLRVAHPGVVKLQATGVHAGRPYLVMDLIEGATLQAQLDREGALPWREAAGLALRLAEALAECHALGVVHRDLKPDNVLLDADGAPRLVDFGLALDLDATRSRLTQSGTFMGTPGYWAPEQASGKASELGPGVDVYGLGAVLYAALTRFPPIRGTSISEAISQTLNLVPESPRVHAPDVPEALERLCLRCLEKDPAQRYPSARAVADALRELLRPAAPPA